MIIANDFTVLRVIKEGYSDPKSFTILLYNYTQRSSEGIQVMYNFGSSLPSMLDR